MQKKNKKQFIFIKNEQVFFYKYTMQNLQAFMN